VYKVLRGYPVTGGDQPFLELIKGLPIYGIKVEGLVLLGKAAKRLRNPTIVLNKALVEVIEA